MKDICLVLTMVVAVATGCARASDVKAGGNASPRQSDLPQSRTSVGQAARPASSSAEEQIAPVRWVFTADLTNARDLGGVPVAGSASTCFDELYRGQALTLSRVGCDEFAALGIRTVVDLRSGFERFFLPNADCVQNSASVLIAPLGETLDYVDFISTQEGLDSIAATFAVLGDPEAYPVYIHCTFGRDRTGVMSALILSALGASREVIVAEYNRSNATVGASPELLEGVLDELDAQGGIEALLQQVGVTTGQLDTLRETASSKKAPCL